MTMHDEDVDVTTQEETAEEETSTEVAYNDLTRRDVRSLIYHVLYAMEAFDYHEAVEDVVSNFNRGFDLTIPLDSDVVVVSKLIIEKRDALDELIKPHLSNWRFDRISVSARLILRFAVWELTETDTPSSIVINEAIELTKCFAETDAYRFVNGVLDSFVKKSEAQGVQNAK